MDDMATMNRRALLHRALLLIGASAMPLSPAALAATGKGKRLLSGAQYKVLTALADTIVPVTDTPGALAAGVPKLADGILRDWASAASRTAMIGALGRVDAAAKSARKKGFAALSAADRAAVLAPFDKAALVRVPPPPGAPKGSPFSPVASVADDGYLKLKVMIVALYYSSEIACTQELIYEHAPGEWQPSIKVTEATRPWASTGPF
ncbi:MAG: hypothetical protein RLZZ58_1225 [Pseudomonadota bacterium]|jgi:hypothetical protein